MNLSADDTNLGMLLPMRAGHSIADYQQSIISDFSEIITDAVADRLCSVAESDAILFSTDHTEDGKHFIFKGCDQAGLVFSPTTDVVSRNYQKTLVFVEIGESIYTFFADLKYVFQEHLHFDMPRMMYARKTRRNKRVKVEGSVVLGRKDGRTTRVKIYDFSPTGVSFLADETDFTPGESILASFEIPACGICETVVTVTRVEIRPGRGFRALVGAKMILTQAQRKKAEQLYLCKKADQMKQLTESSRSHFGKSFHEEP